MRSRRSTCVDVEHNTIRRSMRRVPMPCVVPKVLLVNPGLPGQSVKGLVVRAKSQPGKTSYASSGNGSTGHMAAELFNRQAGVTMLHVPYKGNSQALVDVISGQVAMMFDQVSTSTPQIKAGQVRALPGTRLARSPLLPPVPTPGACGVPGSEGTSIPRGGTCVSGRSVVHRRSLNHDSAASSLGKLLTLTPLRRASNSMYCWESLRSSESPVRAILYFNISPSPLKKSGSVYCSTLN